jgi:hypothetical protein
MFALLASLLLLSSTNILAIFLPQSKLEFKDGRSHLVLGNRVAISGDGNTVIVGSRFENDNQGAAYVFSYNGSQYTQLEGKLLGENPLEQFQGTSVALSEDGKTALVGSFAGVVYVFVRYGEDRYVQQGPGIVGGIQSFGQSIALSGDGNTALIGGYADDDYTGACWIYDRVHGTTWVSKQGNKLVGLDAKANCQGASVALSRDGSTALFGGCDDGPVFSGAWVFARDEGDSGLWSQQGEKLTMIGTGLGSSVALNDDGNVALISYLRSGSIYVFKRNLGVWDQGMKIVANEPNNFGYSVALNGDGNVALVSSIKLTALAPIVYFQSDIGWDPQNDVLYPPPDGIIGGNNSSALISVALSGIGDVAVVAGLESSIWVWYSAPTTAPTSRNPTASGPTRSTLKPTIRPTRRPVIAPTSSSPTTGAPTNSPSHLPTFRQYYTRSPTLESGETKRYSQSVILVMIISILIFDVLQ